MRLLIKKRVIGHLKRELLQLAPDKIDYRGCPKAYVRLVVKAIEQGELTYHGLRNYERIFRVLSSVIEVTNADNGKVLSVETLVSYEKKLRAGEWE